MVGKTSLFTILTGVHESTRMGGMEARVGMTKVPDGRLEELATIFQPPKVTHATVEYLDFLLNNREVQVPSFEASASKCDGVFETLNMITRMLLHKFLNDGARTR